MSAEAYPLQWPPGWPRSKGRRGYGVFQVTPERAVLSLVENLRKIRASHIVVSSNCKLRNDGFPYAEDLKATSHADPGVAVYFQYHGRQMVMAQDAYNAPFANMRSLALAIEAMRSIERHGGGHMMQRSFEGFAALPPPQDGEQPKPKRPWRDVLELDGLAGPSFAQLAGAEAAYRTLARLRHPDAEQGSHDAMAELNMAIEDARAELGAA